MDEAQRSGPLSREIIDDNSKPRRRDGVFLYRRDTLLVITVDLLQSDEEFVFVVYRFKTHGPDRTDKLAMFSKS